MRASDSMDQESERHANCGDGSNAGYCHAKRRYNQAFDLSSGARHADALADGCPASFRWLCDGPGSDHNFGEAQMIKQALGCVVVFGCLMASASLQAHHSTAGVYDRRRRRRKSRAR